METTNQNSNPNALSDKDNVMHWVAVSEQLPETKQHVLVLRTNPNVVTTGYIHEYGHWIWSNLNGSTHKADNIYKVTHWMPLPDPPCA